MNKPVAWIDKNTGKPRMEGFIQTEYDIPLYTHPVKELTDEEIKAEIGRVSSSYPTVESLMDFAKAILRKAQEK